MVYLISHFWKIFKYDLIPQMTQEKNIREFKVANILLRYCIQLTTAQWNETCDFNKLVIRNIGWFKQYN